VHLLAGRGSDRCAGREQADAQRAGSTVVAGLRGGLQVRPPGAGVPRRLRDHAAPRSSGAARDGVPPHRYPDNQMKARGAVATVAQLIHKKDSFTRMQDEREQELKRHRDAQRATAALAAAPRPGRSPRSL